MIKLAHYNLVALTQDNVTTCIYRGERISDGAKVTVKLCKEEYPSARDVMRLRHEYTILKELGDPGLAGVPRPYGLESHGTGLALVIEALPGRSLHEVARSGPLDLLTILQIGSTLAGLLDALHRKRVIHKDLKPHEETVARER